MSNRLGAHNGGKREMLRWTERMDEILVEALVKQTRLGNRVDAIFTSTAYNNAMREVRENTGMQVTKDHLKNRIKSLKHHFGLCYDLFNDVDGFVWSPDTKMFTAKPEVWKEFIKEKPSAKKWMTAQIPHYDKFLQLFAQDSDKDNGGAYGLKEAKARPSKLAIRTRSNSNRFFDDVEIPNDVAAILEDLNDMNDGSSQLATPVEEDYDESDSQPRSESAAFFKDKKRKAPQVNELHRELTSIRDAIKDVADAIREGNLVAERGRPRCYPEQEVFAELVKLGIEVHQRYKAYTFLIADLVRVRAFFGCPARDRKDFLMQLMYNPDGLR